MEIPDNNPISNSNTPGIAGPNVFLVVLGASLLCALALWIGIVWRGGVFAGPQRDVLLPGHGFTGSLALPTAEIDRAFVAARERMLLINQSGLPWKIGAQIAAWLSFLASSVIAILAGLHGHILSPDGLKASQLAELTKNRSRRYIRVIGILAALAAVLTGVENRASEESTKRFKTAQDAQTFIREAGGRMELARSEREARDILSELDLQIPH